MQIYGSTKPVVSLPKRLPQWFDKLTTNDSFMPVHDVCPFVVSLSNHAP
jgi:hypothetical protein